MLAFPCPCGHRFSLPDTMAGESVQCPACGRLVDVPDADEIALMDDDGGLRLADSGEARRHSLDEMAPDRRPGADRRNSLERVLMAGTTSSTAGPARPKRYDPETGELVRDIEVGTDAAHVRKAVPVEAGESLAYANNETERVLSLPGLWLEMLQPGNAFVLVVMWVAHVALAVTLGLPLMFLVLGAAFVVVLVVGVIAHYGAIVEDTGHEERDDLPAPLRGLAVVDDLLKPATHVAFAYGVFVLPAVVLARFLPPEIGVPAALVCVAVGCVFAPVLLLTLTSSGTLNNAGPIRLVRTALACGLAYPYVAVLATLGGGLLVGSTAVMQSAMAEVTESPVAALPPLPGEASWWVLGSLPVLFVGAYLSHVAAWSLGLLYRRHHVRFPWLFQHHVRKARDDAMGQLERMHRRKLARERAEARLRDADRSEARLEAIRRGEGLRGAGTGR